MMIEFKCEKCGHNYKIGDAYAGRKVRCGQCGSVNSAPAARPASINPANGARYADDTMPDFDGLFLALLKHEREAPTLEPATR